MFQENAVCYRFSDRIFQNAIMWLQCKSFISKVEENDNGEMQDKGNFKIDSVGVTTQFDNEFVVIYHNCYSFMKGLRDGSLHSTMRGLKNFAKNKKSDFKVIILFNSVSDSLYNNDDCDPTQHPPSQMQFK